MKILYIRNEHSEQANFFLLSSMSYRNGFRLVLMFQKERQYFFPAIITWFMNVFNNLGKSSKGPPTCDQDIWGQLVLNPDSPVHGSLCLTGQRQMDDLDAIWVGLWGAMKRMKILNSRIWTEKKTVWHVLLRGLHVCKIRNTVH